MKEFDIRVLTIDDIEIYIEDIQECYKDNHLVFDDQSPLKYIPDSRQELYDFLSGFVSSPDSLIFGCFNATREYLYGIIILDNIRYGKVGIDNEEMSCGEVHICLSRIIWGSTALAVCKYCLDLLPVKSVYCMIPTVAVGAISMCKKLGFKKTGYIPNALPYTSLRSKTTKLFDLQIYTYIREK